MLKTVVVIFLINLHYCYNSNSILKEYEKYLEENKNILYGMDTPVFLASLNSSEENNQRPRIIYDRIYYPIPGQKIEYNCDPVRECSEECDFSKNIKTIRDYWKDHRDIVFTEIFVVVDYGTFEAHNRDVVELTTYMAAFWNGVDLRFRQMRDPLVRLNIAGLVIITDAKIEPLLNYTTYLTMDNEFSQKFSDYYDIVVFITQQGSTVRNLYNKTLSFSTNKGACAGKLSSALVIDSGGFRGIMSATGELGFLLGAASDFNSTLSNNLEDSCSWYDGYIMSRIKGSENNMRWSECSIKNMQKFLKSSQAKCLRNVPVVKTPHSKRLPGKLLSGPKQCEKISSGSKTYQYENCNILHCAECPSWDCEETTYLHPPAEGTSCGERMFCLNGDCVDDPGIYPWHSSI